MANAMYDKGRQKYLEGSIQYLVGDIRLMFVDLDVYTPDLANDEFENDLSGIVDESPAFTGKDSTAGVADAADTVVPSVTGAEFESIILKDHTGVTTTSALFLFLDTAAAGLPTTPNGSDITVQWDNGPNKIFKL